MQLVAICDQFARNPLIVDQRWSQTVTTSLVVRGAQHAPTTLVRLREERLRLSRLATVECGLLAVLGVNAAVPAKSPCSAGIAHHCISGATAV